MRFVDAKSMYGTSASFSTAWFQPSKSDCLYVLSPW